jgi:hypothetical protein
MLGIRIPVRLNPDLFKMIGSYCKSHYELSVSQSELCQNPPDLRTLIFLYFTLWTVALKQPIFKRKNVFANLNLDLLYDSEDLSQPRHRDTVPLSPPFAYGIKASCALRNCNRNSD